MQLTPQQQKAVDYLGTPALVVAGAGSGKTRTLTAKIIHLTKKGYAPERLLAITFTNKAAQEMKDRLVEATGLPLFRFPWVRTYHSACFKILKAHCELLGYQQPVQVYTSYQQQKIIQEILVTKLNIEKKHAGAVLAQISNAKNFADPAAYFDAKPYVNQVPLAEAHGLYEKELKNKNAVDFDNILLLVRDLLRDNPQIRRQYQELFQFILVDEYQDTNNLQEELTRLLINDGNLFCVGDDWQAIYSFRGSNIEHFLAFPRSYAGARIFRLEQNFRSTDEIVRLANDLIENNPDKMEKECFSQKKGGQIKLNEFYVDSEEAEWVVRKIIQLKNKGIKWHEMAVLYRTKFCSLAFEQAFRAFQVPYAMLGGKGFFDRKEILDLLSYLNAAVFPKDDVAFERVANTPKRGIGPGTIRKLHQMRHSDMSLQDAARRALREKLLTPKLYKAITEVIAILDRIKSLSPREALVEVLEATRYKDHLEQYAKAASMDFTQREENIEQLIYAAGQKDTMAEFLEETALVQEDKKEDEEDNKGGVRLSTIHAAKGLEFQVVFVVACEEQLLPHWKSLESPSGLQEERRLMYVAITRPEQYLFVSCSNLRKGQFNLKSRFMEEIEQALETSDH